MAPAQTISCFLALSKMLLRHNFDETLFLPYLNVDIKEYEKLYTPCARVRTSKFPMGTIPTGADVGDDATTK